MNDSSNNTLDKFDHFLLNLQQNIQTNPSKKREIIQDALKAIECPYLQDKVKQHFEQTA
ncbi:hypothetical protein [Chondrinema litorale]|uniref:hypothetical protein n=1 Tax=Chondrinema litorale TaxID=2994555 RepID=UPI002543759F|nr:hypothetical protein [Chondrinema litorale]UZR99457.1 hypothetical protein OQ292_36930 [Chondrinema litorale]